MRAFFLLIQSLLVGLLVSLVVSYFYVEQVRGFSKSTVWLLKLQSAPAVDPIFSESPTAILTLSTKTPEVQPLNQLFGIIDSVLKIQDQNIDLKKQIDTEMTRLQVSRFDQDSKNFTYKQALEKQKTDSDNAKLSIAQLKEKLVGSAASSIINVGVNPGSLNNVGSALFDWKSQIPLLLNAQGMIRWNEPQFVGVAKINESQILDFLNSKVDSSSLPNDSKVDLKLLISKIKTEWIFIDGMISLHLRFESKIPLELFVTPIGDKSIIWATQLDKLEKIIPLIINNQIPLSQQQKDSVLTAKLNLKNLFDIIPNNLAPLANSMTMEAKLFNLDLNLSQNLELMLTVDFADTKSAQAALKKMESFLAAASSSPAFIRDSFAHITSEAKGNRAQVTLSYPLSELNEKLISQLNLENANLSNNLKIFKSLTSYMNSYHLMKYDFKGDLFYALGTKPIVMGSKFSPKELRPILFAYQIECPSPMSLDFQVTQTKPETPKKPEPQAFFGILDPPASSTKLITQVVKESHVQALVLNVPQYTNEINLLVSPSVIPVVPVVPTISPPPGEVVKSNSVTPPCNFTFVPFVLAQPK